MTDKLHIIIASTRPGRIGPKVARWFFDAAKAHGAFEPVLVDLADFDLPIFDEPHHPRLGKYEKEHTKAWSRSVDAADAFVIVTPEYNYFAPPSLVNAVNYLSREWNYKPAGFVGYGGLSGGLRAVQSAKQLLDTVKVVSIPEGVGIPFVSQFIDSDGAFKPNDLVAAGVPVMLNELARWSGALKTLRQPAA